MISMPSVRVAVLVPGIMGSSLYYRRADGARDYIWTEDFHRNYNKLVAHSPALTWTGAVAAGELIETVRFTRLQLPVDLWAGVLGVLRRYPDFSSANHVLKIGYDWRQSIVESSQAVQKSMGTHLAEHFSDSAQGEPKLTFLTHSMGGLVVRAALGTGAISPTSVDRIVHIGSPLEGAPDAFYAAYKGCRLPFLKAHAWIRGKNTAQFWDALRGSIQTFPSVYQLMPFPGNDFLSCLPSSRFNPMDPMRTSYLPRHHVQSARDFHALMDDANTVIRDHSIDVFTIVTSSHNHDRTDVAYLVREIAGPVAGYEILDVIGTTSLGDGTVLADSARGDPSTSVAMPVVNVAHRKMCNSKDVAAVLPAVL
jgi:hypothetical protein